MAKDHTNDIDHLSRTDESFTETAIELLELFLHTHVQGSSTYSSETYLERENLPTLKRTKELIWKT